MWEFLFQQNIYRRTYKPASRPVGLEGVVALIDGYDTLKLLRFCNTDKFTWGDKIKQMTVRLIWKYVGIYMSTEHIQTTYKTASRPAGLEGIVALLDGYDASQLLRFCNTDKFIWSGKIKQMKARLMWKYVGNYMSTKHIKTDI